LILIIFVIQPHLTFLFLLILTVFNCVNCCVCFVQVFYIDNGHTNKIYLFGVVAIFSGIYPLAPMIAIAQCAAMYNQDLISIYSSQRPMLVFMRNVEVLFEFMKEWMIFVESLCLVSIVVNCYLAFAVSPHGHLYIPDVVFGEDTAGALWFTVGLEHLCLLAYILCNMLVADVPAWIMKGVDDAKNKEVRAHIILPHSLCYVICVMLCCAAE
jgi:hypothetical protein